MLTHAAGKIATLVFGGRCFLCRGYAADAADSARVLCAACERPLAGAPEPRCPVCALASPGGQVCGRCLSGRPHFDETRCALDYRFPVDVLVQSLKFRGQLALAGLFGRLLHKELGPMSLLTPDLLLPVPLSDVRIRERGYNQSMEIARALGVEIARSSPYGSGPRLAPELCRRTRDTAPQADLPWKQRVMNLRDAFACERTVAGKSIAILDDVMTTGATLNEVAKALKAAGAVRVVNWVVARTPASSDR